MRETKAEIMAGALEGATKAKIIDDNTVEYFTPDGTRVIRFHHTNIVKVAPDGKITLNTGGWHTPTTKERMNGHTDVRIWQKKRVWYVHANGKELGIFQDGMTYDPATGKAEGLGAVPDKNLIKEIRRYAKAFAAALPVDPPATGDCLYCQCILKEKMGQAVPEHGTLTPDGFMKHSFSEGSSDHLLLHIEENYFVPSLLANVLTEQGCGPNGGQAWFWMGFKGEGGKVQHPVSSSKSTFARWIYKYLYVRLVEGRKA